MNCPHCGNELKLREDISNSINNFGDVVLVSTECCGDAVLVSLCNIVSYDFIAYKGERVVDDFGSDIKPIKVKSQAEINEELAFEVLDKFIDNKNVEALDIIRSIKNPLTAAWVVQDVLESLSKPSTIQTKNWLINALYNGK